MNDNHIIFIMFWATWDLAKRKLFWSLYNIYKKNTDKKVDIIAVGRRDFSNLEFQNYINTETELFIDKQKDFSEYLSHIKYSKIEINQEDGYFILEKQICELYWNNSQIVIYLSIWYNLFETVIDQFKKLDFSTKNIKVIFEKPFWKDLESAKDLNNKIESVFKENQIYRIDHYVWKEPVQNIMALRFWNILFEPIWNSNYIDNIQIIANEKIWVEWRWEYYDSSWALRDMVQNHLFQILSIITMEPPINVYSENVNMEKLKILKEIRIDKESLVFWQYDWYNLEKNVDKNSKVETFIAMKLFVNSWRFKDLPIYLKTWKKLKNKKTIVIIEFKDIPNIFYKKYWNIEKNRIIIEIQPEERIIINYNLKKKDQAEHIEQINSEFKKEGFVDNSYDKLLIDCMNSNKILFTNWDILQQSWLLVDDIINCKGNCPILYTYWENTDWPIQSNLLLEKDWRKWFL